MDKNMSSILCSSQGNYDQATGEYFFVLVWTFVLFLIHDSTSPTYFYELSCHLAKNSSIIFYYEQ